jgi:hypothetical protein
VTALVALFASACISAPVSYAPPPDPGAPTIPWIRAGAVTGYLYYYGSNGPWNEQRERVTIPTGGRGGGFVTKILWRVRGGYGRVTLTGRQLDGVGRFTQTYKGIQGSYFPSRLIVPSAGCWRVTVASAGRRASFAFTAYDP